MFEIQIKRCDEQLGYFFERHVIFIFGLIILTDLHPLSLFLDRIHQRSVLDFEHGF